ncbi:MAG: hypothetical protein WD768_06820 [Phycisphaeraceae bacterium]
MHDNRGFFSALIGDGRPLLIFTGLCLVMSGAFALFLSATGHFLPHDVLYLGMEPADLCAINECRIVHFMFHDRVSFGGAIIAVGVMYMWLAEFPLRHGEAWAWWLFLLSGIIGFGSFLAYLGYGYLDSWHGAATLALLPCFIVGLVRSYVTLHKPAPLRDLFTSPVPWRDYSPRGLGRLAMLVTALGMIGAGLTIMTVGMTVVFVPQDLSYMGITADELRAINPRLIPLIAHDRAGFGGGVATAGLLIFFSVLHARPSRSLWQALFIAGLAGFSTAVGIHPVIGYTDFLHLAPAAIGAMAFGLGLLLTFRVMMETSERSESARAAAEV